jgi:hypothetical protein
MDYSEQKTYLDVLKPAARQRVYDEGQLVATMLHRVWAKASEPLGLSVAELSRAAPRLLKSGGGALGWSRIRKTILADSTSGAELHEAYRLHTLEAEVNVARIKKAFALLEKAGLNPVLVKGWAIARIYPELGLRPYGDIDVCVPHSEFAQASALLERPSFWGLPIDLHEGFASLGADSDQEFLQQSRRIQLDDVEVTVLSPEHHLRALCVHMLRHGAFRPLWLVDIAVALENRPANFDWELCMGNDPVRAGWVECAIGLAHQLLGARTEDTPMAEQADRLPRWLVKRVLKSWSNPQTQSHGIERHVAPMKKYLRDPRGLVADLKNRWPDPIEASISIRAPFNRLPRWPFQLAHCFVRAVGFAKRLPRTLAHDSGDSNSNSAPWSRGLGETTEWGLIERAPE